jgi:Zn-dependent peptidase ImmA (M78 family)
MFVLCHEFGHFVLHQKLSIGQQSYNAFKDSEYNFRTSAYDLQNPKQWIEWQANCFAAALIMPSGQFQARLWLIQDHLNRSRGKILLDDNGYHIKEFYEIVNKLAYQYYVTKTTIIYKLKEMNLINNQSRVKTVGQLIDEFAQDLLI